MPERQGPLELNIPVDHPAFAGHFPGRPVVPGVVLLDEALQHLLGDASGWTLASVKFLSVVKPGEALSLWYSELPGGMRFEICCAERRVASGSLLCAATPVAAP